MKLIKENCVPFWGTEEPYGFLSNFYETKIIVPAAQFGFGSDADIIFRSSEQLFMLMKAGTFGDDETFHDIIEAKTPMDAKRLGRKVAGFDNDVWKVMRYECMVTALMLKFEDEELKNKLLGLRGKLLIEASPSDTVWGIGLEESELIYDTDNWRGANLLGTCLMYVRDTMISEEF